MVKFSLAGAVIVSLSLSHAAPCFAQSVLPLADLEALIPQAPAVTIASLEESSQKAALAASNAHSSGALSFGVSAGSYRELITQTVAHTYTGATPTLGVRFPLTPTFEDQEVLLQDSATLAHRHVETQAALREALRELRTQYATYWGNQRKEELTKTFLSDENDMQSALAVRSNAHLSLPSEQLEINADYALAHKNQTQFTREEQHALEEIGVVTGKPADPFVASDPYTIEQGDSPEAFANAAASNNPALIALSAQLQRAEELAGLAHRTPLEAGVSLQQSAEMQSPGGAGIGRATTVGVDLRMPLEAKHMSQARREEYGDLVKSLQTQITFQTQEVRANAHNLYATQEEALQNERFAQAAREAASQQIQELLSRRGLFPEATVEKTAQSRFAFYQAAITEIDARVQLATQVAQAAALCGDSCASQTTPAPELGAYVWESRSLLRPEAATEAFRKDAEGGRFGTFLVSLNAEQLHSMVADPAQRDALRSFISSAHDRHVRVGLLLGDPHWLEPRHRDAVSQIVRSLTGFSFDELHLDIEPRQLLQPEKALPALYAALVNVADDVSRATSWPIALDVNYRDVRYLPLDSMRSRTITLMIYASNPRRVAEIARPILDAHPDVRFAIAQSVEPSLSPEESYASKGRTAFLTSMMALQSLMTEQNFAGIEVQSYANYREMKP